LLLLVFARRSLAEALRIEAAASVIVDKVKTGDAVRGADPQDPELVRHQQLFQLQWACGLPRRRDFGRYGEFRGPRLIGHLREKKSTLL
jgi:hypothetical protein